MSLPAGGVGSYPRGARGLACWASYTHSSPAAGGRSLRELESQRQTRAWTLQEQCRSSAGKFGLLALGPLICSAATGWWSSRALESQRIMTRHPQRIRLLLLIMLHSPAANHTLCDSPGAGAVPRARACTQGEAPPAQTACCCSMSVDPTRPLLRPDLGDSDHHDPQ